MTIKQLRVRTPNLGLQTFTDPGEIEIVHKMAMENDWPIWINPDEPAPCPAKLLPGPRSWNLPFRGSITYDPLLKPKLKLQLKTKQLRVWKLLVQWGVRCFDAKHGVKIVPRKD